MNARTSRFWWFQAIFWSVAGLALFVSGATQMPLFDAFVRNLFLLVAGFLSSFFLAMAIDQLRWLPLLRLRLASYLLAYLIAVFCVVFINTVSYTLRDVSLGAMTFGMWFSGALNLGLVYAFWAELFIQQIYLEDRPAAEAPVSSNRLVVEHRGALVPLPLDEITFIAAAGDYVEVHTGDRTYLERNTLQSLQQSLGSDRFLRVHRSKLVNAAHVRSVKPLTKGRYRLHLEDGSAVESSRGYRDEIRHRFLAGAT